MAQFDLCPKCGAVSRDGLCSSCGYKIPGIYGRVNNDKPELGNVTPVPGRDFVSGNEEPANQGWSQSNGNQYISPQNGYQNTYAPKQSGGVSGFAVGLVVVLAVFAIAIMGIAFSVRKVADKFYPEKTESSYPGISIPSVDTSGMDDYLKKYGMYSGTLREVMQLNKDVFEATEWVQMTSDPYEGDPESYEFDTYFDDSVNYDLESGYWIYSNNGEIYNSDDELYPTCLYMYGNTYRLSGTGLANEDALNELIYNKSVEAADIGEKIRYYTYDDVIAYVDCETTVAYADDEKISFLFYFSGYLVEDWGSDDENYTSLFSHITSLNINLKTGAEIKASEMFDFGGNFYEIFKDQCLKQNGAAVDYYEDSVLSGILTDDESVVWAFTPLGIEVGVNREAFAGWSTGTFKDYSKFFKVY